jgi:hypothetical protein
MSSFVECDYAMIAPIRLGATRFEVECLPFTGGDPHQLWSLA